MCAQMDHNNEIPAEDYRNQVAALQRDFRTRMTAVYVTLCSDHVQRNQRAPYLRQFLLRLNFNGYLEAAALEDALKTEPITA